MNPKTLTNYLILVAFTGALAFNSINLQAHCDTMNGPVITAAKLALDKGDVKLILIWVSPKDEAAITELFNTTLKLRKINPEVKQLADRNFFENLVRIHRAGEGEPYIGIKDSIEVEPPIAAADKALETGSLVDVMKMLSEGIEKGVKEKFDIMMTRKNYDKKNVEAGREFVESYVTFMHYVEGIYATTNASSEHHGIESEAVNVSPKTTGNEQHQTVSEIDHNSGDHISHILIIAGVIIIITVQILVNRKKT
jgi:hypothetical protein